MRTRPTILGLMGLVLVAAVGIAALRAADELWDSAVFTVTLALLATACLGAILGRGRSRAFYAGAALFGIGYGTIAFGPWCESSLRPRLLTTRLLDFAYPRIHPAQANSVAIWDTSTGQRVQKFAFSPDGKLGAIVDQSGSTHGWYSAIGARKFVGVSSPGAALAHFQAIGHSLSALLAALIGGVAACWFFERRLP